MNSGSIVASIKSKNCILDIYLNLNIHGLWVSVDVLFLIDNFSHSLEETRHSHKTGVCMKVGVTVASCCVRTYSHVHIRKYKF